MSSPASVSVGMMVFTIVEVERCRERLGSISNLTRVLELVLEASESWGMKVRLPTRKASAKQAIKTAQLNPIFESRTLSLSLSRTKH